LPGLLLRMQTGCQQRQKQEKDKPLFEIPHSNMICKE
jgi:hypothetical protein